MAMIWRLCVGVSVAQNLRGDAEGEEKRGQRQRDTKRRAGTEPKSVGASPSITFPFWISVFFWFALVLRTGEKTEPVAYLGPCIFLKKKRNTKRSGGPHRARADDCRVGQCLHPPTRGRLVGPLGGRSLWGSRAAQRAQRGQKKREKLQGKRDGGRTRRTEWVRRSRRQRLRACTRDGCALRLSCSGLPARATP